MGCCLRDRYAVSRGSSCCGLASSCVGHFMGNHLGGGAGGHMIIKSPSPGPIGPMGPGGGWRVPLILQTHSCSSFVGVLSRRQSLSALVD